MKKEQMNIIQFNDLKDSIERLNQSFEQYKLDDTEWKERAEPSVAFFEDFTAVKKFTMWACGTMVAAGTLFFMVKDVLSSFWRK